MNNKVRTRSTGLAGITNLSLLAPLRTGMVPGLEPISYVERLSKVLDALHESRRNLRESELRPVFPDVVGRFGAIHGFRYCLVPPDAGPGGLPAEFGTWRLSLNVTFDGGWEPYMRLIYRDIGPLLDLLFCHCPDYGLSTKVDFEPYCDWVRRHEIGAGLFFADSPSATTDDRYLTEMEALQRDGGTDLDLARHQLKTDAQRQQEALQLARSNIDRALALPLRTLKGLYRLTTYFQPYAHGPVLHRFAQDALRGPIALINEIEKAIESGDATPQLRDKWTLIKGTLLRDELQWLEPQKVPSPAPPSDEPVDVAALQAHVLGEGEQMTHGCLLLLQVKNPPQALKTISMLAGRCGPIAAQGEVGYMVGFTYAGLEALGVTPDRLAAFPQEFYEGMEARASILGDLRTSHPDRWTRPLLRRPESRKRVDLRAVHLLLQVRLEDRDSDSLEHPRLMEALAELEAPESGLRVLAAEYTRSYREKHGNVSVGHLGIADGVSQPTLREEGGSVGRYFSDKVSAGELLLGYANDRGDGKPATNKLMLNGSFLAVRKLRQFMDRIDALPRQTLSNGRSLLETMVGRSKDGEPLHGWPAGRQHANDFDFSTQAASDACPFHSHVRRTNPRDGRAYIPRILRRGMSWGVHSDTDRASERGSMFMAYCASLAEQFETIQRWVAGGNASGVGSAQGDPLLRVPQEGADYTFRYIDGGQVKREALPKEPLVQLQWGLYAFVPSLDALRSMAEFTEAAKPELSQGPQVESPLEVVRPMLEDRRRSEITWRMVRDVDPRAPQDTAYGHLVGTLQGVLEVLRDDGTTYSVKGYGQRMDGSIGLNMLGMDPAHPRRQKEMGVKHAIARVTEQQAFDEALGIAQALLGALPDIPSAAGDVTRKPIDLADFSSLVLAKLCNRWFGVPDEKHLFSGGYQAGPPSAKARCPGSLGPASRYMFMPHPDDQFEPHGKAHAKAVRDAIGKWLATSPPLGSHRLSQEIVDELKSTNSLIHLADNIAGAMLGFTPSVQSNFLRVMETWLEEGPSLWLHQQSLLERLTSPQLTYDEVKDALKGPLLAAMRKQPVPTMAWRYKVVNGAPDTSQPVIVGLRSALADPAAPSVLVFGRDSPDDSKNTTAHGCPGYQMAMGVMLAMMGALMTAGTLRPTGSPVLLILTPH